MRRIAALTLASTLLISTSLMNLPSSRGDFVDAGIGTSALIRAAAWKPDGSFALLVGQFGTILKFNGTFTEAIPSNTTKTLYGVAWKPDGSFALIVGEFGTILAFQDPIMVPIQSKVQQLLLSVAWKPDGSFAIISGAGGTVLRFDGSSVTDFTNRVLALNTPNVRVGDLRKAAWKPDGSFALIVGTRGVVLSTSDGQTFRVIAGGPASIDSVPGVINRPGINMPLNDVAWKPDGSFAIIVGAGQSVLRTDGTSTPIQIGTIPLKFYNGVTDDLVSISWRPDGAYAIVVSYLFGQILKFDGNDMQAIRSNTLTRPNPWTSVAWHPSGRYSLIVGAKGKGLIFTEEPPNLNVQISPPSRVIRPGETATYAVSVSSVNAFRGDVSFFVFGQPSLGVTPTFTPVSASLVPGGQAAAFLQLKTTSLASNGFFFLRIGAAGEGVTQNQTATLAIQSGGESTSFAMQISPENKTLTIGTSGEFILQLFPFGGFNEPVTLQVSGLPSGITEVFNPRTISAPGTSRVRLNSDKDITQPGIFELTFTGTGRSLSTQIKATIATIRESLLSLDVRSDRTEYFPLSLISVSANVKLQGQPLQESRVSGATVDFDIRNPAGAQFRRVTAVTDTFGNATVSFTLPTDALVGTWNVNTLATAAPTVPGGNVLQTSTQISFRISPQPALRANVALQTIDVGGNARTTFKLQESVLVRVTVTNVGALDLNNAAIMVTVLDPRRQPLSQITLFTNIPRTESRTVLATFPLRAEFRDGQYTAEVVVATNLISQNGLPVENGGARGTFQVTK